jgi:hypothetical protein
MYYVFGTREDSGELRYFVNEEGLSIFRFASNEDAVDALNTTYGINPDFELFKLIPASAALCEC